MREILLGASLIVVVLVQPAMLLAGEDSARQEKAWQAIAAPQLMMGAGHKNCDVWLADRNQQATAAQIDLAWVFGFLSSYNVTNESNHEPLTGELSEYFVGDWIDNFCRTHSKNKIVEATLALIADIFKKRTEMMERTLRMQRQNSGQKN